jgi:hypothetical protein
VQALTQPALTQNYPSDYACVMKVVFERVSEPPALAHSRALRALVNAASRSVA